ncbi:acetyl-CoA synthetase [Nematocida sp. LUAm3]|nr:acetyl-CoA synthetase [Nematocida sp. LUAm3]KAI5173736.1 acetyl-CoA synthetase [Nematocida sp. LUAm2]KAI5176959.1 acetyl-CoA synthetase [Nematocida sp. LUAm1]
MKEIYEHGKKLRETYHQEHKRSLEEKDAFFMEQANKILTFTKNFTTGMETQSNPTRINWFKDGELNACYNAVDRHAERNPEKVAILYENDAEEITKITYGELKQETIRYANYLKSKGVQQGNTVCIYMPMEPKALIISLACARLGAAHTVVFGGFSSESLSLRIEDSDAVWLVTSDSIQRGGRKIEYLPNASMAIESVMNNGNSLKGVLVFDREDATKTNELIKQMREKVQVDLLSEIQINGEEMSRDLPCVSVPSENILFHLYTSGSTGRPKGLSHSTAGYLLYAALTTLVCFDVKENDIFFCTAELGWITGHSYVLYGPLTLGVTTVVFGGIPTYPDPYRFFRSIERTKATQFYTAPTAIRLLQKSLPTYLVRPKDLSESTDDLTPAVDHIPDTPRSSRSIFSNAVTGIFNKEGYYKEEPENSPMNKIDLSSLRVLGSVGEPINKGAYIWYSMFFGNGDVPIIDTYWQTEAGGVMLCPLIGVTEPKPESASFPFFGMNPTIIKKEVENCEEELEPERNGLLIFKGFWPGIARTIVKNHERYQSAYFPYENSFYTGDEACKDADGYFWIRGRVDDVINVSGHRLSTAEIESAVCSIPGIAEAAALGQEDEVTGQSICIFVVTSREISEEELFTQIKSTLRKKIGAVIVPKRILSCPELPKTSTGKMMRRVLRKVLTGEEVGDISTCINPDSIEHARSSLAK